MLCWLADCRPSIWVLEPPCTPHAGIRNPVHTSIDLRYAYHIVTIHVREHSIPGAMLACELFCCPEPHSTGNGSSCQDHRSRSHAWPNPAQQMQQPTTEQHEPAMVFDLHFLFRASSNCSISTILMHYPSDKTGLTNGNCRHWVNDTCSVSLQDIHIGCPMTALWLGWPHCCRVWASSASW